MKLFLCSYRIPEGSAKYLEELSGEQLESSSVAMIINAKDLRPEEHTEHKKQEITEAWNRHGAKVEFIDVAAESKEDLRKKLAKHAIVGLAGGNTFELLFKLKQSGADEVLWELAMHGKPFYCESAGALVLGPTIKGFGGDQDFEDFILAHGNSSVDYEGLSMIDFVPVVHAYSKFEGYEGSTQRIIEELEADGHNYKTIADDKVLIVN